LWNPSVMPLLRVKRHMATISWLYANNGGKPQSQDFLRT